LPNFAPTIMGRPKTKNSKNRVRHNLIELAKKHRMARTRKK
jgi:hypothetical protein